MVFFVFLMESDEVIIRILNRVKMISIGNTIDEATEVADSIVR